MQSFKVIENSTVPISHLHAFSITTYDWGFEGLPNNTIALAGTWDELTNATNKGQFPKSWDNTTWAASYFGKNLYPKNDTYRGDNSSSILSLPVCSDFNQTTYIGNNASTPSITWRVPCGDSPSLELYSPSLELGLECQVDVVCWNIIENAGRTRVGPKNWPIEKHFHVLSSVIPSLIAFFIMGLFSIFKKPGSSRPKHPRPLPLDPAGVLYRQQGQNITPSPMPPINLSGKSLEGEIRRCGELLRQLYRLDKQIWARAHTKSQMEVVERESLKQQADVVWREIKDLVEGWEFREGLPWTDEERRTLETIRLAVEGEGTPRYGVSSMGGHQVY